jgi:hypothetical protein
MMNVITYVIAAVGCAAGLHTMLTASSLFDVVDGIFKFIVTGLFVLTFFAAKWEEEQRNKRVDHVLKNHCSGSGYSLKEAVRDAIK